MATSKLEIGWRNGVVKDVRNMTTGDGRTFIKFFVEVQDKSGTFRASSLCRPTLVPGGDLYKWIRVCNVSLADIDDRIRPDLFREKAVRVHVVQNGEFFNITDCKTVV